eukprot:scaffold1182_cov396-Prasinococcus_capsulatus_cf.AAC.13
MMLRYGLDEPGAAERIENAQRHASLRTDLAGPQVTKTLDQGLRTGDIMQEGCTLVGCKAMGAAVLKNL